MQVATRWFATQRASFLVSAAYYSTDEKEKRWQTKKISHPFESTRIVHLTQRLQNRRISYCTGKDKLRVQSHFSN